MSKKDKKIKKLKREVKELKAQLRKLKMASLHRRRTTVAKAPVPAKPAPKTALGTAPGTAARSASPKPPAQARPNIDTPAEMAMVLKSISAVRPAGQR